MLYVESKSVLDTPYSVCDTLPPSIVSKWRGLRGLEERLRLLRGPGGVRDEPVLLAPAHRVLDAQQRLRDHLAATFSTKHRSLKKIEAVLKTSEIFQSSALQVSSALVQSSALQVSSALHIT